MTPAIRASIGRSRVAEVIAARLLHILRVARQLRLSLLPPLLQTQSPLQRSSPARRIRPPPWSRFHLHRLLLRPGRSQWATLGTSYSLQLGANGGAGALAWALGSGTSLPDTLALSATGMITGTPTGTSGTFNFKVHVTDSGNPQLTSPDVQLTITVAAPPISVGVLPTSAYVELNGSTNFVATVTNDQPTGNVDWTLTLNGSACTVTECGSVSPISTASGMQPRTRHQQMLCLQTTHSDRNTRSMVIRQPPLPPQLRPMASCPQVA